jgi:hypothetical protein
MLLYIVLAQAQFAVLKTVIDMSSAIDVHMQRPLGRLRNKWRTEDDRETRRKMVGPSENGYRTLCAMVAISSTFQHKTQM